jgi:putative membrane protein
MQGIIIRLVINSIALWVADWLIGGLEIQSNGTLIGAALLLGVVNAIVRPFFVILTLPITIMTLGIFLLVINAAMLGLVAKLLPGFVLQGFWPALGGAAVVSLVSWIGNRYIGPRGNVDVWVVDERRH